jgi:hypothetical protein
MNIKSAIFRLKSSHVLKFLKSSHTKIDWLRSQMIYENWKRRSTYPNPVFISRYIYSAEIIVDLRYSCRQKKLALINLNTTFSELVYSCWFSYGWIAHKKYYVWMYFDLFSVHLQKKKEEYECFRWKWQKISQLFSKIASDVVFYLRHLEMFKTISMNFSQYER